MQSLSHIFGIIISIKIVIGIEKQADYYPSKAVQNSIHFMGLNIGHVIVCIKRFVQKQHPGCLYTRLPSRCNCLSKYLIGA